MDEIIEYYGAFPEDAISDKVVKNKALEEVDIWEENNQHSK